MRLEIDQSGKIEDTSKHTFLAFSNKEHFVIKISSMEKRKLQKHFRKIGKSRIFIYLTLATLIIFLLKNAKTQTGQIIIDIEYLGKGHLIKDLIKTLDKKFKVEDISFHQVGKKSPAHYLAHGAGLKLVKPGMIIKAEQILKFIKKSGSA